MKGIRIMKNTAIYIRVSTGNQNLDSQISDIERWIKAQDPKELGEVLWFEDKFTGRTMDRPGWNKVIEQIDKGMIQRVVIWRMDRLGRMAGDLCGLFDYMLEKKIRLVSLKDHIDLSTPTGKLMANILASIAAFETEVRGERVAAGIAAAKAKGKRWGGSKKGQFKKVNPEHLKIIKSGEYTVRELVAMLSLSRSTVYRIAALAKEGRDEVDNSQAVALLA